MKNIDPKSLTIGILAASLVFACTDSNNKTANSPSLVSEANAATSKADAGKWDDRQEWLVADHSGKLENIGFMLEVEITGSNGKKSTFRKVTGWEPYGEAGYYRKRIK